MCVQTLSAGRMIRDGFPVHYPFFHVSLSALPLQNFYGSAEVKMTTLAETKVLVLRALQAVNAEARELIARALREIRKTEPEFLAGIIEYSEKLWLTSDEWFDLLCKFPQRVLRDDLRIMSRLSENQLKRLPPPLFD